MVRIGQSVVTSVPSLHSSPSTRTDLQTHDLNRHWDEPSPTLHPTIYHSKMLLKCLHRFSSGQNPVAFLDLHGHSRRHNIFSYSCSPFLSWRRSDRQDYLKHPYGICNCSSASAQPCQLAQQIGRLKSLSQEQSCCEHYLLTPPFVTLPITLDLQHAPAFDLESCSFVVQRDREPTARIVCWRQLAIPLTYTIECSAAGCNCGPYAGNHLSIRLMEEMGMYLASSFALIGFLYCTKQHYPVVVLPKQDDLKVSNTNIVVE